MNYQIRRTNSDKIVLNQVMNIRTAKKEYKPTHSVVTSFEGKEGITVSAAKLTESQKMMRTFMSEL